ncbi:Endocytosis and vacuole integrity protein [Cyanidiococcus yangmingshanensis]|uniref:Endocytosis and vacuole integrity protein n=1 Tax=Cyanidiococcus yangmingshanensis TaxID=2690220 RepID=A0A7J7ILU6_9RHOD|nr:Endocytosis and vacuole integrity protein [Cyanidiococcus yangmingshanensis]
MQLQTDSRIDANNAIPSLFRCLERNLELALQANVPESGAHSQGDAKSPTMAWNPNTWLALVESILALDEKVYASAGERLISIAVRNSLRYDNEEATGEYVGTRTQVPAICLLEALLTVAQAERENASSRDHAFQYAVRVVTAYLRATEARALESCPYMIETSSSNSAGNEEHGTTSERDPQPPPPLVSWMTPIGARLWERFEQFVPVMAAADHQAVLEAWSQLFKGIFLVDSEPEPITADRLRRRAVRPVPQARLFAPLTGLIQEANSRLDQELQEGVPSGPHPVRLFCDLIQLLGGITQDHGELLTADGWTVVLFITKQATLAGITIQTARAKSDRRAIQEAGFTLLQLLANEYAAILMHMSSESACRALWIETLAAWALYADDVNMALSSVGMLWNICDLLDPGERNDAPLWLQIFATLAQIGQVDRAEVRNSALKTLLGALLAHGEHLSVDRHWKGIWEEVLIPLAACLLADPGKPSAWKRTSPFRVATDSVERAAAVPVEEDLTVPEVPESAAKQWNASRLLLLEGLVRLIHRFLASRWLDLEPLPSYWQTLLTHWERTVWLSEDDGGVPSNHTDLLLALIALWQVMLETLAGLLFHHETSGR